MLRSCTVAVLAPTERTGRRLEACFGLSRISEIHTGAAFLKVLAIRKRRVVYVMTQDERLQFAEAILTNCFGENPAVKQQGLMQKPGWYRG